MVLDCVNKVGLEPIAGRKGKVGLLGPRRKRDTQGMRKGFLARLWEEKDETCKILGKLGPAASDRGRYPRRLAGDSVLSNCASWQVLK